MRIVTFTAFYIKYMQLMFFFVLFGDRVSPTMPEERCTVTNISTLNSILLVI